MKAKLLRRLAVLSAAAIVLLSACTFRKTQNDGDALIWGTRNGYEDFLKLADQTYPDIVLDYSPYAGPNRTSYDWAQMRGDDIPDIFITTRNLDPDLAAKRLADLSGFDFTEHISSGVLDQASVDGGVYLLPVNGSVHGIYYNKTLMEEHNWAVPSDLTELEALCGQIRAAGMTPGLVGTKLNDDPFSAVFNVAKTDWLSTPEGADWEQEFLSGGAPAAGMWETAMEDVQRYIDMGMFSADLKERSNQNLIDEELGNRRAMFFTSMLDVSTTELPTGDQLGMMPYLSRDGSKNVYIYQPSAYIGISRRLTEPGNEKKLEDAVRLLSLLYSPEGQSVFSGKLKPCLLSPLDNEEVPEDALIYDAWQAQQEGRIAPVTYTGWEHVLYDMGKVFKRWLQGEEGLDGQTCISLMDALQTSYLSHPDNTDVCESTANFTLEETAALAGKALGNAAGADAAMIPVASFYKKGDLLSAGISGKLYKGIIDADIISAISPGYDGEYAVLTMTGAQVREMAEEGFNLSGKGEAYPYVLVTKGGASLEDDQTYQVAFLTRSYTKQAGELYHARLEEGSFTDIFREWLKEQQSVSPDGNPWE